MPVLKFLSPFLPSTKVIWLLLKPFERSNGRWMSLAPFLVVLLMELADSPGWLSCSVRSLHRIGGQDQSSSPIEWRWFGRRGSRFEQRGGGVLLYGSRVSLAVGRER